MIITRDLLLEMDACDDGLQRFGNADQKTLTEIVEGLNTYSDKFWLLSNLLCEETFGSTFTDRIALAVANAVIDIYEAKIPFRDEEYEGDFLYNAEERADIEDEVHESYRWALTFVGRNDEWKDRRCAEFRSLHSIVELMPNRLDEVLRRVDALEDTPVCVYEKPTNWWWGDEA